MYHWMIAKVMSKECKTCEEDEEVKDGTGAAAVKPCEGVSIPSISWTHSTGAKRSTCRSIMCYQLVVYWCQF